MSHRITFGKLQRDRLCFSLIERSEGQNPDQTLLNSVISGSCFNRDSQLQGKLVPKL